MRNRFFSRGWLVALATTFSCLTGCNKPKPNAPTQDFAQRHRCPVKSVKSMQEGSDRMRVTGCYESEVYVRRCGNHGGALPPRDSRQPLTEAEARISAPGPLPQSEPGCAWSRELRMPAPATSGAPQPKWLSQP